MKKSFWITLFLACALWGCKNTGTSGSGDSGETPNIIVIYADDLGYGDVGAYKAGTLNTPNLDNLADGGMRFTNGYASSATCTPSRYALLTGVYPWRNERARILSGTAPLLIDTSQVTLPKMLREMGYQTGIVGKWHLGLGDGNINWNERIAPGPNEVGFDYAFIMAATQDRVPTVYIENGNVVGLDPQDPLEVNYQQNFPGEPTGMDDPGSLKMKWHYGHNGSIVNGISRIGYMRGGKSAHWIDEDMADTFLERAKQFIGEHKQGPFFLYYALQQPHVPRTPHPRFVGKSGMGPRGDAIVEADWCVGELMKTLEEEGLLENTLILFSSDNGPVLDDGYYDDAVEKVGDHTPWGPLRGGKYSLFEAGTRVPFITYWKGRIEPGVSDAVICQIDLLSSLAELVGSEATARDSKSLLDVLLGTQDQGREELIMEATTRTAIRKGEWKMIPPYEGPSVNTQVNIELGNSGAYLLYHLSDDPGEQKNLAGTEEGKLQEMVSAFDSLRGNEHEKIQQLRLE